MTTAIDYASTIAAGFKAIASPSGRLEDDFTSIVDRDVALSAISTHLVSIRAGNSRRVLISGPPGSGRSYLLSFLALSMNRFENTDVIPISFSKCRRLSDFELRACKKSIEFALKKQPGVLTTREDRAVAGRSITLFIDDVDLMLLSWNTNGRFLKSVSRALLLGRSIVATTSSISSSLESIPWDEVIRIDPLSTSSLKIIMKRLVEKNISKDVSIDDMVADYCAVIASKKLNSSVSAAVSIMERAARAVDRGIISGNRATRAITMKDMEDAFAEMQSNRVDPSIPGSKILIMAMLFIMKRATVETLRDRLSKIFPLICPGNSMPSVQLTRDILNGMVSAGIARKIRSSGGKSAGVKTTWACDAAPGMATPFPGEVMRVMKLIASGGKRRG